MLNSPNIASPRYWPAWLSLGLLWCISRLPKQLSYWIGTQLGLLIYLFPSKLKRITQTNIRLCFPDLSPEQQTLLIKNNFRSVGLALIETTMAWWLPDHQLKNLLTTHGIHYLKEAIAKGQRIILLSPHFITLEMVGRLIGMDMLLGLMYRPHKKPFIAYLLNRYRKKYRAELIANHEMRKLIRALERQIPIWYAYDIDVGQKNAVFAPFFNIQTSSMTALSRIAEMTKAIIIPVTFFRHENIFQYELHFLKPLDHFPSGDYVNDATQLNATLEKIIREHPDQYVWQYKRFKTRPAGEHRFYK